MPVLTDGRVDAALPCQDFERAKNWYKEKLGLAPTKEDPGGAWYTFGEGTGFFLFPSSGKASGDHTQVGIVVKDVKAEVDDLKSLGVVFEEYDFPGLKTVDGVAEIEGESAAWFKDSEGNLISVAQRTD
jgi:catechol 2,3-dioxygenase-like lactoylglutathione lyase family enzyme